ncbi:hypothetical protein LCGC14_0288830 [marine sediment metagenome]|uniref:Uncharacterized protein n=1 Tax=marine sediment metagenome TaxID=412755 RepID=A0A0F9WEX5_9ZZZZ
MPTIPTVDQLRKDIASAHTDLARLEGQQQSAETELAKLEAEATELGLDPSDLTGAATQIRGDVDIAVTAVREEIQALKKEAPSDEVVSN